MAENKINKSITKKAIKPFIIEELLSTGREGMEELVAYLEKYDYFEAPASMRHHNNFKGGLALHSYYVRTLLEEKNERFNLGLKKEECIIAGYLHDLCKVNLYELGYKLRKENGEWVARKEYTYNEAAPLGHGEKSVIIAQRFIKLTDNELLMILYHMGLSLPKEKMQDFDAAKNKCKAVTAIATADMEAAGLLEEEVEGEIVTKDVYNNYIDRKRDLGDFNYGGLRLE